MDEVEMSSPPAGGELAECIKRINQVGHLYRHNGFSFLATSAWQELLKAFAAQAVAADRAKAEPQSNGQHFTCTVTNRGKWRYFVDGKPTKYTVWKQLIAEARKQLKGKVTI